MSVAGELLIDARWDGAAVQRIEIASTRPPAARLLTGRTVEEAIALVPLLFSICARAQETAARAATEAAQGGAAGSAERLLRTRRVLLEAVQEHLWRLLLDWPAMVDLASLRELFVSWHKRTVVVVSLGAAASCRDFGNQLLDFVERVLLPLPPAAWQGLGDAGGWREACAQGGALGPTLAAVDDAVSAGCHAPATRLLPALLPPLLPQLSAAQLAAHLPHGDLEAFARAPTLDGQPCETGALAAHHTEAPVARLLAQGRRPLARVCARIAALLACARRLAAAGDTGASVVDAHAINAGIGLSRVHTARGMLVHRVELVGGKVARYLIVAPTEWNFHPQGALAQEFTGRRFASEAALLRSLRVAVLALDPCVAHRIGVRHA